MSFMQPQVVPGPFVKVETSEGDVLVPKEFYSPSLHPGDVLDENVTGWFGRMSAPGYMDCTDWDGPFETPEAAQKHLDETYGDDEEFDDSNDPDADRSER